MSVARLGITIGTVASLVWVSPPVFAAGSGTGATPNLRVTYSISDVQFDGPGCVRVPVVVDYTKEGAAFDDINGRVSFDIRYPGSSSSNSPSVSIGYFDPQTGRKDTDFSFCPFKFSPGKGPLQVTGTVQSGVFRSSDLETPLSPSSIAVNQNPTTMSRVKVKKERGYYVLSGTATAQTPSKGAIGAQGRITVQVKKKGSNRWVAGTSTSPDSFGAWRTSSFSISTRTYPRGTQFRVIFDECSWCTGATRTGQLP